MLNKSLKILATSSENEVIFKFFHSVQQDFATLFEEKRWVLSWWYFIPVFKRKKTVLTAEEVLSKPESLILLEKTCLNIVKDLDRNIKPLLHSMDSQTRFLTLSDAEHNGEIDHHAIAQMTDNQAYMLYSQNCDLLLLADDIYAQCSQMIPLLKQSLEAGQIQKKVQLHSESLSFPFNQDVINHAAKLYDKVSAIHL